MRTRSTSCRWNRQRGITRTTPNHPGQEIGELSRVPEQYLVMSLHSEVNLVKMFCILLLRLELLLAVWTLNHLDRLFIPSAFLVAVCPRLISDVTFVRGWAAFNFFICRPNSFWYLDTFLFFFFSTACSCAPSDSLSDSTRRMSAWYSSRVSWTCAMSVTPG